MKECPKCGKSFNWWERAVGEHKEHVKACCEHHKESSVRMSLAAHCKGCPAGCFEGVDFSDK